MLRILILFLYCVSSIVAQDVDDNETNIIDTSHKYISEKVEEISNSVDDIADKTLNNAKNFTLDNNQTKPTTKKNNQKNLNPESVDALFQNEKYINETRRSFLRLSSDYVYNSLDDNDFNVRLTAKLALSKSRKNFKLYLSGFNQDNVDDIVHREEYDDGKPEIGVSYVTNLKKNIETKYSLGIRSLYPYVRGRFSYKKETDSWIIEPVQTIEYSLKDEFKEDTKLYLDTEIIDRVKFRLEFSRGTESTKNGMDYSSNLSIFWTPQPRTGLQFNQGVYGNTKYEYTVNEITEEKEIYSGINNYVTTLTFRQNFYRKWLFYEVSPGVNFSKNHDFDPNYRFYVRLDAFFGNM
jgi:hypothetical protein